MVVGGENRRSEFFSHGTFWRRLSTFRTGHLLHVHKRSTGDVIQGERTINGSVLLRIMPMLFFEKFMKTVRHTGTWRRLINILLRLCIFSAIFLDSSDLSLRATLNRLLTVKVVYFYFATLYCFYSITFFFPIRNLFCIFLLRHRSDRSSRRLELITDSLYIVSSCLATLLEGP
jgi:hypothetical protein